MRTSQPLLLLALEEYFMSPSPDILGRLYDSCNAISTAAMPNLNRNERILLRHSERKDMFEDKFVIEPTSGTREFFEEDTESSTSSHRDPSGSRHHPSAAQGTVRSSLGSRGGSRPSIPARQGSAGSSSLRPVATPPSREGGWVTPDLGESRPKGLTSGYAFLRDGSEIPEDHGAYTDTDGRL